MEYVNGFKFTGKMVYRKPLPQEDGYFGGTMQLLGQSKREDSLEIRETKLTLFVPHREWNKLDYFNVKDFDWIKVEGHFESWLDRKDNLKLRCICDKILDVECQ